MMMKIKYNSWKNISISIYKKIVEINNDEIAGDIEKQISTLALLCDIDEEEIWNMDVTDVNQMRAQLMFINELKPSGKKIDKISINGVKYNINYNINKMNYAQYVDFNTYYTESKDNEKLSELLSTILIPSDAKRYGDGYDVADVINDIENNLSVQDAVDILFFFLQVCQNSISLTLTYLEWITKLRMMMTRKESKRKEMYRQLSRQMKLVRGMLGYIA